MKVLVLLSLVAVCFSKHHTVSKHVTIREDGTINVVGTEGKEIDISRNVLHPRKLDLVLRSPLEFTRKMQVDETNILDTDLDTTKYLQMPMFYNMDRNQITQHDVLINLFHQYEGIIDESTYQVLLDRIQSLVDAGLVHKTVIYVLRNLEQLTGEKRIAVREDGTITVMDIYGREIDIYRNVIDARKVDMIIRNQFGDIKKVPVDLTNVMDLDYNILNNIKFLQTPMFYNVRRSQITQHDILVNLFSQHEGIIDEPTYEVLLEKLQYLVKNGLVHETVYNVLRNLDQISGDKHIVVKEDGTITILSNQDREIDIYRNVIDPRKVNLILRNSVGILKKIQVDEANIMDVDFNNLDFTRYLGNQMYTNMQLDQYTQADILMNLLRQYEGTVDEQTFQELLQKIQYFVNSGLIHETVFEVLRSLEQLNLVEKLNREQNMVEYSDVMNKLPFENMHDVRNVMFVEGVVPTYLRTLTNNQNDLKYKDFGLQRLWNVENMTPYQRFQMLLQQNRQGQTQQHLEEQLMIENFLNDKMTQQQRMEQQWNQQWNKAWNQQETPRWMKRSPIEIQKFKQTFYNKEVDPIHETFSTWNKQVVPQMWNKEQVIPQQSTSQVLNMRPLMEQRQILPQKYNILQQYYQRMMPVMQ